MKYDQKSFTVPAPASDEYRENWDRIFRKPAPMSAPVDANGSPVETEPEPESDGCGK